MNRLPASGWLSQGVPPGERPAAVWLDRGMIARARATRSRHTDRGLPIRTTDKDHHVIIGDDRHKLSHTAAAMEPLTNIAVASLRITASASPPGRELVLR